MKSHLQSSEPRRSKYPLVYLVAIMSVALFVILSLAPNQVKSQSTRICDEQIYHGVKHCTDENGDIHLLLVDLTNPHVKVQTVLPTNGNGEECNSVNSNNHPNPDSRDTTSNCTHPYPRETARDMLDRYVKGFRFSGHHANLDPVAIINTDYFGADQWGAQGLAVRVGDRLDGEVHNDDDAGGYLGSSQPSLAISEFNTATIGIPGNEQLINENVTGIYYNTVGGAPIIVQNGSPVNDNCTYPYPGDKCARLSQSAAGLTDDGRLILMSARRNASTVANYFVDNHKVTSALKFDGGGSVSMAWVDSNGNVNDFCSEPFIDQSTGEKTCRKVAEGLLVFSEKIQPSNTVDVALIIDSSGSMDWNDPDNKRIVAARAYLTASLVGDSVGIVDFDSGVRVASPLLKIPDHKSTLIDAINTINSSGGTNIGIGVERGCDVLKNYISGNTIKAAILLTDGQGAFNSEDSCFSDRGWPIYTFGFGDADDLLLQEIALNTGGEFARLPTSDFVCEFQRVRSDIAGVPPAPCTSYKIGPFEITIIGVPIPPWQEQATFSISWVGSDVEMSLISPSGRIIDRSTIAPDVVHDLGSTFEVYTILDPEPGDWEVKLFGADVPSDGEEVVFGFTSVPKVGGESYMPIIVRSTD